MRRLKLLLTCTLGVYFGINAVAQDKYFVTRLKAPIVFDGMPDEKAWDDIPVLKHRVYIPVFDGEPTERTEMYVTYDDKYVYVAGRLYYEDVENLSNVGKKRDEFQQNSDYFGIMLDTFNDNLNYLGFLTTPSGVRLILRYLMMPREPSHSVVRGIHFGIRNLFSMTKVGFAKYGYHFPACVFRTITEG